MFHAASETFSCPEVTLGSVNVIGDEKVSASLAKHNAPLTYVITSSMMWSLCLYMLSA